jgi:hypothetical protein
MQSGTEGGRAGLLALVASEHMVSFTVLSKDRACQLDLLLRSARLLAPRVPLTVLWTATTPERRRAYDLARERFPEARFVQEEDFCRDVKSLTPAAGAHGWLCDDDVFLRPVESDDPVVTTFLRWPQTLALSLRLHPGVIESPEQERSLPATRARKLPSGRGVEVRWAGNPNLEWANPFSLDGHLYQAQTVQTLLAADFVDPASMRAAQERQLRWFAGMRPRMLAWEEPRLICAPLHKLDSGTVDPRLVEALNDRYLSGRQISLDPFLGRTWARTRVARPFELELRRVG